MNNEKELKIIKSFAYGIETEGIAFIRNATESGRYPAFAFPVSN